MRLPVQLRGHVTPRPRRIACSAMLIAFLAIAGCGPSGEPGADFSKAQGQPGSGKQPVGSDAKKPARASGG
jgi:hypothetical protein